ncbi:MAG: hypothetical protein SGCHY_004178, partial [Lobulomycetales sp.]
MPFLPPASAAAAADSQTGMQSKQVVIPTGFDDVLQDLNREILRDQPSDIIRYCADYFSSKLAQRAPAGTPAGSCNPYISDNDTAFAMSSPEDPAVNPAQEQPEDQSAPASDMSDDDDDDDILEEAPAVAAPSHNRNRRTSVSAESMAPASDASYVKVVIPKGDEQRKRIEASVRNNFLFKSLDEEQYVDVVDAMAEKKTEEGEEIIKQGGVGDFFYVVETGTFDVYVSRNGAPAVKVFDYGPGGSFGELALMYNAPRAATVRCTSSAVLWALDRVTFRRILMENTSRKRRMYENFLEEVPLLVSLEAYERHKIADALESVTFNDGDFIIKQGDVGDNFYIIEAGETRVTQVDESGVEHELPGMKKGDYFGELALLTDKPRKATIIAKGRVKLATLGKKAFVRLLGPVVDIIK